MTLSIKAKLNISETQTNIDVKVKSRSLNKIPHKSVPKLLDD